MAAVAFSEGLVVLLLVVVVLVYACVGELVRVACVLCVGRVGKQGCEHERHPSLSPFPRPLSSVTDYTL